MRRRTTMRCILILLAVLTLPLGLLAGCSEQNGDAGITSIEQLNAPGLRIGVAADTAEDRLVKQEFPNARIEYFQDEMSGYLSVSQGKIDAYVFDKIGMETAIYNGLKGVRLLDGSLGAGITGAVAVSPVTGIPDLENKLNAFLDEIKADGTFADIEKRRLVERNETMPEIELPQNPDLKLVVGTTGISVPFTYYVGTELTGYDIELAYRFAAWLGASIEFKIYDYAGIVPAALAGDVDCIFANLFITPEREETIRFSHPTYIGEVGVMVRDTTVSAPKYQDISELKDKKIGVLSGSNIPELVRAALPDAKILYFNSIADEVNAIKSGRVDAGAFDDPVARNMQSQDDTLTTVSGLLDSMDYAFILDKTEAGQALCAEIDEYLIMLRDNGTLKSLQDKWFDSKDISAEEMPDYDGLPDLHGTVRLALFQNPPFTFSEDGQYGGYDIELMTMFCREYGYALKITDVSMDAILPAVQSGKSDVACCGITITEERKENILFSVPNYSGGTALLVLKNDAEQRGSGFWSSLVDSFDKTFIRENRWKLILSGVGTTTFITVLSVVFGTLLGFFAFMLCRNDNPAASAITRFCVWLVQGMPVVVLLMILYYIIFSRVAISGTAISIVGFTLIFGAAVFSMIKAGVGAVGAGQLDAAYTLGYTNRRAFFRVILPQALPHFMPAYKAEITSLIKATAVVGYVAVQDLTKMGDIIRARTYEAFFPLLAVAVIYYVLAAILTYIVSKIEIRIDPRRRTPEKILKGVVKK